MGAGLIFALFTNNTNDPLTWFALITGAVVLSKKNKADIALIAWLVFISISVFIVSGWITHRTNANEFFWCVLAAPVVLSLAEFKEEHLKACLVILAGYSAWTLYGGSYPVPNPNNAAALMNISALMSAWVGWYPLTVLFMAAMYLMGSTGAILALSIVIGTMMAYRYRLLIVPFAVAILIAGYYFIGSISVWARLQIWQATWELIKDYFWLGTGLGSFERVFAWYQVKYAPELVGKTTCGTFGTYCFAHNDPLQFMAEMGVLAAILFYLVMLRYALRINKNNYLLIAGLGVVTIHSHFTFNYYIPAIAVAIGLCLSFINNEQLNQTKPSLVH